MLASILRDSDPEGLMSRIIQVGYTLYQFTLLVNVSLYYHHIPSPYLAFPPRYDLFRSALG